jgi:hypothetical protein
MATVSSSGKNAPVLLSPTGTMDGDEDCPVPMVTRDIDVRFGIVPVVLFNVPIVPVVLLIAPEYVPPVIVAVLAVRV